jgi:DNA helicase HerA-like ATPase
VNSQTLLGHVGAVSGPTVNVRLSNTLSSGAAIIGGSLYSIAQVGSFVRIPLGFQDLFGIVTDVGATASPVQDDGPSANWLRVQLVGESIGSAFERGIGRHPNVNDEVHIVTERDLARIYGNPGAGQVAIGRLSSAESVSVRVDLSKIVTRHSAVLGSTGSGKSTTVTSLVRSIVAGDEGGVYPSARILMLDIHGEYAEALADVARVFRVGSKHGEHELYIPFWALEPRELLEFLTGGLPDDKVLHFYDKIVALKQATLKEHDFPGAAVESLTIDTPIPYSLRRLWYDMIEVELRTLEGPQRDQPALEEAGDPETMTPPRYRPHAMGSAGPFLNTAAPGVRRQLLALRSRMMDRQYDFLLHPGGYEPGLGGSTTEDLPSLLAGWLGHDKPVTVLDLSGIPSTVLMRLVGSILKVIYEALFWSRDKSEGGRSRPLLVVMEEAHRYLSSDSNNTARDVTQRIVKEGRKYGIGAMIVSQRPSEVDDTILSQCGTFFALRMSNSRDRERVRGTLPENLASMMDMLPVLRTGEAIVTGEAATLPLRCRVTLPNEGHRPQSEDPEVARQWGLARREESYDRVVASWRAQSPLATTQKTHIVRTPLEGRNSEPEQ